MTGPRSGSSHDRSPAAPRPPIVDPRRRNAAVPVGVDMIPERALSPRVGDVWRRESQRLGFSGEAEWYTTGERRVISVERAPTVDKTRVQWAWTLDGAEASGTGGYTTAKLGGGRACSLSTWRGWCRERRRISRWPDAAEYAATRLLLVVDGLDCAPTQSAVLDLVRRLAEAHLPDPAEELAFIVIRGWDGIDPDRIRDRMRWAEELLP